MQLGKSALFVKSCERTIGFNPQFIKACTMHWLVTLNMSSSLVWSTMASSSMLIIPWPVVCWARIMKTWQPALNPILVLILKPTKAKCKSAPFCMNHCNNVVSYCTCVSKRYRDRYWNQTYFDAISKVHQVAKESQLSPTDIALRWMVHHSLLNKDKGDGNMQDYYILEWAMEALTCHFT